MEQDNSNTAEENIDSNLTLNKKKPGEKSNAIRAFKDSKPWYKNPVILFILLFLVGSMFFKFLTFGPSPKEVDYGEFLKQVEKKDYDRLEINPTSAVIYPKDKNQEPSLTTIASQVNFTDRLKDIGVDPKDIKLKYTQPSGLDVLNILSTLSLLVFIGIIGYSFFSAKNIANGGPMMGFGDSKAKLFVVGRKQDVKFDQVKGVEEALDDVKEIVDFLKYPDKFIKLGARIPKGVLLFGPPGTGKTLLARAIAGEAGVPFFFTSGSEFEEMLVGTGASRVRDLFTKAKKSSPSIIFIDEIDSIARKRGTVINSGNTEQTLNQILVEMDGFDKSTNVIVIAATNRPDVLDPAILRPGRFDRRIILDLPDVKGREEILKVHAENKPLGKDVDFETIAKRTIGFSGADLENTMNEAAIIAAKAGRQEILFEDIEEAATKVTIGPAKKRAKSERQKKLVAYHEAGHAIASYFMEGTSKVHKISIVSRGYTGGVTMYLPEEDDVELKTEAKFKAELVSLFGGRSAEKVVFDSVTTGASSDIQRATHIARDMVKKYGMSKLGYILFENEDDYNSQNPYSEKTAELIDIEVKAILDEAQKRSEEILIENRKKLDELSELLMVKESVEAEEFYELMGERSEQGVAA